MGSRPTHKHYNRLKQLVKDEHIRLLQTFVNYEGKSFITFDPSFWRVIRVSINSVCCRKAQGAKASRVACNINVLR